MSKNMRPSSPKPSRPSRQQVAEMRRKEQEGVPFTLHRTGGEAKVKVLSLTDHVTLLGIPPQLQGEVLEIFNETAKVEKGQITIETITKNQERQERLANAICVVGFVEPRLVMTEDELDENDPDLWLVDDLHIEERVRYLNFVMGRDTQSLKRLQTFLVEGVAS